MVVGVLSWQLHLDGCHSLKEKRMILRSLKDRLRARLNVSVAETDHHDSWQRAELAVVTVAGDFRRAESILGQADGLVAFDPRVRIIDSFRMFH
ncbi:MAG: DUF503 domain-containing protein [Gemmatimonadetes bacterium]|nr:DUF503 domain-containing protein [Gemmatimonadota bacterium]